MVCALPFPAKAPPGLHPSSPAWHSKPCMSGPTYPPIVSLTFAPSSLTRYSASPRRHPEITCLRPLLKLCPLTGTPAPAHLSKFPPGFSPHPKATSSGWSPPRARLPFPYVQRPQDSHSRPCIRTNMYMSLSPSTSLALSSCSISFVG